MIMTTQGQGHSLTFVQGHSELTFSNFFSSKKHQAIWSQISYGASMGCWYENMFKCSKSHGQDGVQAHIYGKNLQNHLLQNQKAGDIRTWYTALGTQVQPNLFKW